MVASYICSCGGVWCSKCGVVRLGDGMKQGVAWCGVEWCGMAVEGLCEVAWRRRRAGVGDVEIRMGIGVCAA